MAASGFRGENKFGHLSSTFKFPFDRDLFYDYFALLSFFLSLVGTTVEQDGRWGKSDDKLIAKMEKAGKISRIMETKVDLKKVNIEIISKWVQERIIEILGFEDEITINMVINHLQAEVIYHSLPPSPLLLLIILSFSN